MNKVDLMAQLEKQLRGHDWYYQYSDDHRYWKKGQAERSAINATLAQLTELGAEAEAKQMFNDLSPEGFGFNG